MNPTHKIKTSVKIPVTKWATIIAIRRLYPNVNWVSNYHPSGRNYRKWSRAGALTSVPRPTSWAGCFQGWRAPLGRRGAGEHLFLNSTWKVHVSASTKRRFCTSKFNPVTVHILINLESGLRKRYLVGTSLLLEGSMASKSKRNNPSSLQVTNASSNCQFLVWGV